MEEIKLFEELNILNRKIDFDLNFIKTIEYEIKIKSTNLCNKQLFEKLDEQGKIIEKEKGSFFNDFQKANNEIKSLQDILYDKEKVIDSQSNEIDDVKRKYYISENKIKELENKINLFESKIINKKNQEILEEKNKEFLRKLFENKK
jgi:hypothetical protein